MQDDRAAFADTTAPYARELHAHCYRMLGSYHEAEDVLQETMLRAWRKRASFEGRASLRTWLYRIATNACLDLLAQRRRRPRHYDNGVGTFVPWLEPWPDPPDPAPGPESALVARETVALSFLVAVQHLPPRQRAAFLLVELLDWSAREIAELLDVSVPAVKSLLQRARSSIRAAGPADPPTGEQRALVDRYVRAHQSADLGLMAEVLAEDVRLSMPPLPVCFVGRDAVLGLSREVFDPGSPMWHGRWRSVVVRANGQPAVAHYCEIASAEQTRDLPGAFRAQVLDVLRIEGGVVSEITGFEPRHFPAFGLPLSLP